jgi:hypothetical protein
LAIGAPTGVTQVLGGIVLAKSGAGLYLNAVNLYRSFTDEAALPSSAFGYIANKIAPCSKTAQGLASVADLATDLGFSVSARLGAEAAEAAALRVDPNTQPFGMVQIGFANPSDLGRTANAFAGASVVSTVYNNF